MAWLSKEEQQLLLSEYQSSNESVKQFCKRRNISLSSFQRWRTKEKLLQSGPLRMLPVISAGPSLLESVELLMPKGMCLRFSQGASALYVAGIIKALAQ
jgi:hypothetical protein